MGIWSGTTERERRWDSVGQLMGNRPFMITLKQVAVRKDDHGIGWHTLLDVEIQFGTIEPHTVTIAVPQDAELESFGASPQAMVDLANQYAKKVLTDAASTLA